MPTAADRNACQLNLLYRAISLAEFGAKNGPLGEPHPALEMRAVIKVVLGGSLGNFQRPLEGSLLGDQLQRRIKTFTNVGPKVERIAGL